MATDDPTYVVCVINFDGGVNSLICDTRETARRWLASYVKRWWAQSLRTDDPLPESPLTWDDINFYFEYVEEESYCIDEDIPISTWETNFD